MNSIFEPKGRMIMCGVVVAAMALVAYGEAVKRSCAYEKEQQTQFGRMPAAQQKETLSSMSGHDIELKEPMAEMLSSMDGIYVSPEAEADILDSGIEHMRELVRNLNTPPDAATRQQILQAGLDTVQSSTQLALQQTEHMPSGLLETNLNPPRGQSGRINQQLLPLMQW